jgi:hypothetical protein
MKAIKGFLFILILLAAGIVSAQTGQGEIENWAEVRGICTEAGQELIEVTVSDAITEIIISPDASEVAWAWYPGEEKSRSFWIDDANRFVSITIFVGGLGFTGETYWLGNSQPCEHDEGVLVSPVYECLGIGLADFVDAIGYRPESDGFVVDGNFYHFHETLSFIVPEDAVWVWDLYVDGRHVLRFEQSAAMRCTITAIYPQ